MIIGRIIFAEPVTLHDDETLCIATNGDVWIADGRGDPLREVKVAITIEEEQ